MCENKTNRVALLDNDQPKHNFKLYIILTGIALMREFSVGLCPRQQELVSINAGWVVDGFQIGSNAHVGGGGGQHRQFMLAPGETIIKISGSRIRFENRLAIGSVTFETNQGRIHGPFGCNGNPSAPSPAVEHFAGHCYSGRSGNVPGHHYPGHHGHHVPPGHHIHGYAGQQLGGGGRIPGLRRITGKVIPGKFIHSMNFIFQE